MNNVDLLSLCEDLSEVLSAAIRRKDLEAVKFILSQGGDANGVDIHSRSNWAPYLHLAPNVEITRELLNHGSNVNSLDSNGCTALHYAITYSKGIKVIKELVERGADMNVSSCDGFTPLTYAVLFGNLQIMKELLKYDVDHDKPIRSPFFEYNTPLGIAVSDFESGAKLLIKNNLLKCIIYDYHQKIIDLSPYKKCKKYMLLTSYQEDCWKEISLIKSYKINHKIALHDFMRITKNFIKPIYTNKNSILEEIKSMFPIYEEDLLPRIKLGIERTNLLRKWQFLQMYNNSSTNPNREVVLDHDSMYKISDFLSNDEISVFFKAFEIDFSDTVIKRSKRPKNYIELDNDPADLIGSVIKRFKYDEGLYR